MPGENIQDWSVTAVNNANSDTSINWAEGQPRASVNNSARSMMAAHAKQRNLLNGSIVTGGAADAQTFTSGVSYTAPIPTGLLARLKIGPGLTNTTAATLEMDGLGAVAIKDTLGADLAAGAIVAGAYAEFVYNGTNWILLLSSLVQPATQAEQEAATSTNAYVSPGRQQYHPSAAKAWCFASTTGIIAASYNVSSVTDAGVGFIVFNYTVPLSANHVAMPFASQQPLGTAASTLVTQIFGLTASAVSAISVNLSDFSQTDPTNWHFVAYGDI